MTAFVGPTSGGNVVVIAGTNFTGATAVKFDTIAVTSFTVVSASQITATAPAGVSTVNVSVTTAGGTSNTTATGDDYTYATPAVTSVIVNGGAIVAKDSFGNTPILNGSQTTMAGGAVGSSIVEQFLVTFNMQVRLDNDAFAVSNLALTSSQGIGPSAFGASVVATGVSGSGNVTDGFTQYVLTFAAGPGVNSFTNVSPGNSFTTLKNGYFSLDMTGSKVHAGVSDTAVDHHEKVWALYGAVNTGDILISGGLETGGADTLLVDGLALNDVYATFGASAQTPFGPPVYNVAFDWNLDGHVDGIDLNQLYSNFGTIWKV